VKIGFEVTDLPIHFYVKLKGTVYPEKIFSKYVMLRTVTKNYTKIMMKYPRYHRNMEIIKITGGPPLRLLQKPDLD